MSENSENRVLALLEEIANEGVKSVGLQEMKSWRELEYAQDILFIDKKFALFIEDIPLGALRNRPDEFNYCAPNAPKRNYIELCSKVKTTLIYQIYEGDEWKIVIRERKTHRILFDDSWTYFNKREGDNTTIYIKSRELVN